MTSFLKFESLKNWGLGEKILAVSILAIILFFYPFLLFSSVTTDYVLDIAATIFKDYFLLLLKLISTCLILLFIYGLFFQNIFKQVIALMAGKRRFYTVLVVGIAEFFLLYYFIEDLSRLAQLFTAGSSTAWFGTVATTLIASPIAFLIWSFRNTDKRIDQQHKEEDIRQADFHKLEEWATTIPTNFNNDSKDKEIEVKSALQIAALYQLLPFLLGEHGSRFVRPTMEIYRSLLANWSLPELSSSPYEEIENLLKIKPRYIDAIYSIIREEFVFFKNLQDERKHNYLSFSYNNIWIPLGNIQLDGINLLLTNLEGINLHGASLKAANLTGADFKSAVLDYVNFSNAQLGGVHFYSSTSIKYTKFINSNLSHSIFEKASLAHSNFSEANLSCVDFSNAHLDGSGFGSNLFDGIDPNPPESPPISAQFDKAILYHADFTDAILTSSHFYDADFTYAKFYGANLYLAIFTNFNLGNLLFSEDDLNRWINDDLVEFNGCYVYKNNEYTKNKNMLELFEKAGVKIR